VYAVDRIVRMSGTLIPRADERLSDPSFSSKDFSKTTLLNVRSAFMVCYVLF
jgi:hypothetical protein